jgi:hypothetical protein
VILPVGLDYAEIQFAIVDYIQIENGTASGFNRAANLVLFAAFVHKPAYGSTSWVVDTGEATGSDAGKGLGTSQCWNGKNGTNTN